MPVSRAALKLADEGLDIAFGTSVMALRAICGTWQRVEAEPTAVHDRFPSWTWPDTFAAATAPLEGLPFGNPIAFRDLCRDKVLFQEHLELPMPEIVTDPGQFEAALEDWGAAFLKPRFGGLGRGVRRVVPGDPLPVAVDGAVAGVREPSFLQRAVPPPRGLAGLSSRWLWQREPCGAWTFAGGVARISKDDPVTNVDRGARVEPVDEALGPATLDEADAVCRAVCAQLEDPCIVEVGLDLVVDCGGHVHVIEANSRPGGRLRALGPRFHEQHVEACARPLRALHALSGATSDRPGQMAVS
ncbi:MAG TPA: hypothetical protein QGF58_07145 [Myxococcota bacterium]|nr:hypothetical protein [Myxococcota bacterium]